MCCCVPTFNRIPFPYIPFRNIVLMPCRPLIGQKGVAEVQRNGNSPTKLLDVKQLVERNIVERRDEWWTHSSLCEPWFLRLHQTSMGHNSFATGNLHARISWRTFQWPVQWRPNSCVLFSLAIGHFYCNSSSKAIISLLAIDVIYRFIFYFVCEIERSALRAIS